MVQETATQIPEGLTADPPPEAPVSEEAIATPDVPATSEESAPPPSWATVYDPAELPDHPEVKPFIDKRVERIAADLRVEHDRAVESATRNLEGNAVRQEVLGHLRALDAKIDAGDTDAAERLLGRVSQILKPYEADALAGVKNEGFQEGAATQFGQMRGAMMDALDERGKDALSDLLRNPSTEWKDVTSLLKDRWATPYKDEIKSLKLELEKVKASSREGQGPNLAQGTTAGGKSDDELLLDPTTPIHIIKEIRARQGG